VQEYHQEAVVDERMVNQQHHLPVEFVAALAAVEVL
jgi:hypothetical protein